MEKNKVSMDDNYIMTENMRLLAEKNPSLHKQIDVLQRKLELAIEALEKCKDEGLDGDLNVVYDTATNALSEIEKIK